MCEDGSPVKALNFLQTEVSSVVDHNDPHETELFRSLLTHLLSPSSGPSVKTPTSDPEHEDSPPKKRSRPITPDTPGDAEDPPPRTLNANSLRESADPLEEGGKVPSGDRFKDRNDLFEKLLEYISQDEKQPSGSLLDIIDGAVGLL